MTDLTFLELSEAGNNCCVVVDGKVYIDVSLLTGDTISSLNDQNVLEMLAKLLKAGYEAQEERNESLASGLKLGAISPPSSNVPILDGGKIIVTTEFSLRLRYAVDLDNPTSPLS